MFYDKLKSICSIKGIDVTPFIHSLGMSSGSITAWRSGSEPRNSTKKRIADALGVDVSFFSEDGSTEKVPGSDYIYIGNLSEKDKKEMRMLVKFKEGE